MNIDETDLLRQAKHALKAGQKQEARRLLQAFVQQNPHHAPAWLWLASVAPSPRSALEYIARAEAVDPGNPTAQKARAWAEKRLQTQRKTAVPPQPAPPTESRSASRRPWLIGVGVFLIIALLLAGGWGIWTRLSRAETAVAESAATPTPTTVVPAAVAASPTPPPPTATPTTAVAPILAKNVHTASNPRATWTLTPTPTNTPTPSPTPLPTFVTEDKITFTRPQGLGLNERWVDVNLTTQTLVAFEGNTPVLTTKISSGAATHPTVTGQFRIYYTYESQTMDGRRLGYDYYLENVPYVMYFFEDYALHGTYWHNNFGTPMSHGCVNMKTPDAGWLYEWADIGTLVNVHY